MMSKAALDNLEASGQGDSPLADMARTGMTITKVKIIVSIVVFIIALIIFLSIVSSMNNQQNNFGAGSVRRGTTVLAPPLLL